MKKVVLIVATLMLFVKSSMVYAGQFGPPEPTAKKGEASLGLGYFYYSSEWRPKSPGWRAVKITQNQAYLQASYGIVENGEVYLRFGFADVKGKDAFVLLAPTDFEDNLRPFGTIGIKGFYNVTPPFGIGYFLQWSIYSSYEDKRTGTVLGVLTTETLKYEEPWDINFGIGLQGKIREAILYGGPFVYSARAEKERKVTALGITSVASTTYREKNNVGGFAGIRLPLGEGLNLGVEVQLKSRFSIGGALTYAF